MSADTPSPEDRLLDLLIDHSTVGLSAAEQVELERLLAQRTEVDSLSYEHTAAVLDEALADPHPPRVPEKLRQRLHRDIDWMVASQQAPAATTRPSWHRHRLHVWAVSGWVVAAASILLLLTTERSSTEPSPQQQLASLLRKTDDVLEMETWVPGDDATVQAVVFWSESRQEGYLRLVGLPPNDPQRQQYQLWIFDAPRDDRFPTDGGVFNIPSNGEVIVPIRANLPVREPRQFVITREPPGGVMVSDRQRIVALAQVGP